MSLRAALLAAGLLMAGCSGSGGGTTGTSDAGGQDAGGCHTLDAGCTAQVDCGEPADAVHIYACLSGTCTREAGFTSSCFADVALPQIQIALNGWGTNKPGSFEIRAYYPQKVDGSALSCADVQHTADFPDGGSPLDVDPSLNIQNVSSAQASCTSGQTCTYLTNVSLVPGTTPVVLVQAYSGGRDATGTHATGIQLGDGCVEGTSIAETASPPQNIPVTVNPGP